MPAPNPIEPVDYLFKTEPYQHQREAFMLQRDIKHFALLMGMGTGKTKLTLDTVAYNYDRGRIDILIVVAPKGVHRNWIEKEIPEHLPDWTNYRAATWMSPSKAKVADRKAVEHVLEPGFEGLRVIAFNMEAFRDSTKCPAAKLIRKIVNSLRVFMVIDESSKIKTPGSKRTMALRTLGKYTTAKRILTGTPVTQGPLDLYSQFNFLDPNILGFDNFITFKHYFAEWERELNMQRYREINANRQARGLPPDPEAGMYETLTGYKNIETLKKLIAPHSYRITKEECLDLPEKIYMSRFVEMSDEQRKIYNKIVRQSIIELEGEQVTINHVLTKLLRLQQVLGGFVPIEEFGESEPIPGPNLRIESLMDMIGESNGKWIIWARFRAEIKAIQAALWEGYGAFSAVMYYGDVKDEDRTRAINRFQGEQPIIENHAVVGKEPIPDHEQARFFIGQQHSGGYGLTLTAAENVDYYSNDFSLEARLQSEDRAHRIGQDKHVTYTDQECPGTVDSKIISALKNKMNLADMVTGDSIRLRALTGGSADIIAGQTLQDLFAEV
jgi:SNF2 family DNA or RNA helicase